MAYASDSIALAALEVLAHLQSTKVLQAYSLVPVRFPEESVEILDAEMLPERWRRFPSPVEIQAIGDRWVAEQRSLILRVPSVIIPAAANYLINPLHPECRKVVVGPQERFAFDPRLLKN